MAMPRSVLCPTLVGRDDEVEMLHDRVDRVEQGRGGVVVVVGEAGAGKSRLARDALTHAVDRGMEVLSGRAVPGRISVPYRPLTEAFLGAFRDGDPPESPELEGFEGHLGRLVPRWRAPTERGADESPVLLGEAVTRLLRVIGRQRGVVLLVEDLHWADAESLAVIEYLADALTGEPVLCVATCRPDGAPAALDRLRRHPDAVVVDLAPLTADQVAEVVATSLGAVDPPAEVVEFVVAHSDGNPFHVEELLAGLVASGSLTFDDRWDQRWTVSGILSPTVPTDVANSIRARTAAFDPTTRRVIGAAAVLGRRFDWDLVPGVAEVDGRTVTEALRAAVDAQLVEVDGHRFRFRHVLTREAVLAELLPPERHELSRRARTAIERAHPDLPGPWCELAAELAEASGDRAGAARLWVESARRALTAGALTTARATAERARYLAAGSDPSTDADEVAVQIAAASGRPVDALDVGRPLLERMDAEGAPATRRAELALALARAALTSGDLEAARGLTSRARQLVDTEELGSLLAAVEAVAAHVALGADDLAAAESLARAAVDHAGATGQPAVACEALEVLGRVGRMRSVGEAVDAFERAAAIADRHGLTGWSLRARQELALERWVDGDTSGLRDTRDLAARVGAMVTVAVMDLSLADVALSAFDRDACLERATACVEASRRYGLATLSVAELWLAGGHALAGDDDAMEAAAARALARDPDDPRILGDLWGRVRATRSIIRDDRDALRNDLDTMMEHVAVAPVTTSIFPNRLVWLVLHSADDDDFGVAAQRQIEDLTHLEWWTMLPAVLDIARSITLGRRGHGDEATELAAGGLARTHRSTPNGSAHYVDLLLAEAQLRDGWGDPVPLLRAAEAFFGDRGYDLVARRCRVALGRAGEKMPRRGRGDAVVPEHLRAVGITSRELDVLGLIVEGCSNRDIAARLHVSPKTVERHVGSLFDRTGIRNRTDLAAWVVRAGT